MVNYIRENRLAGYVNNSGKQIEDPNFNDDNEKRKRMNDLDKTKKKKKSRRSCHLFGLNDLGWYDAQTKKPCEETQEF